MWRFVAAVLLVVAAAGGQNRVIYDGTVQDDEVMVVAGQPQVVVLAEPRAHIVPQVLPAPSSVAQFVVVPQELPQGQQMFQFLVPPMQQDILLPSPRLPDSCGPFIVSLVSIDCRAPETGPSGTCSEHSPQILCLTNVLHVARITPPFVVGHTTSPGATTQDNCTRTNRQPPTATASPNTNRCSLRY